ncbi:putative glycolipid-binding domain-containing protein [Plantactinospora sp. CA-290183]|uniref:putative glycolipid-binding domain-containing protein n=1 Tax=Plantactinospora sp. CA-290183 TaxID=3240006 RepID=UPI003D9163D8
MPRSLFWVRTDVAGADHALVDDRRGLAARGVALAVDPIPYSCRYELRTDENWSTVRLEVNCEGSGWLRTLRLERAAGRWRASTGEQGDLDAALTAAGKRPVGLPGTDEPERLADAVDVDLGGSPLFNTLPVHRLRLRDAVPGTKYPITTVWVLVPSLRVVPSEQVYTVLDGGNVGFASGDFTADLTLDADGYVLLYPGLAERTDRPA